MAFGIKREDILYATLHMDESNPHLHLCFFPSVYIKDQQAWKEYRSFPGKKELPKELYGDCNRIIDDEEQPVGCSQKRFTMGFLHYLNANMEKGFKERGINVKLSTGRGQIIDVQKASKPLREAAAIARGVEEESKRRNADLQSEIAMQEGKLKKLEAQIEEKETVIKNLKKEINRAKEKLAGLTEAILEAKEILEGMCSRVKGLISSGLDRIKRAKSHKEKEDVAKAAEEQLIRIKTDADAVMTMFMPYDDEEEEKGKADPEKEYDGDERDDM